MLRSFFIYISKASWARRLVTRWPVGLKVASRFIAGETLDDAVRTVRELNGKGINATLDMLGEHTTTLEEASRAKDSIISILDRITGTGVRSNVSLKLSQIGMTLDESACLANLAEIVEHARKQGIFVRVDMEDSPYTELTLRIIDDLRMKRGFENVGVVIQSYLYRSEADIRKLAQEGTRVRLCKGAYKEPASIAFPKKSDVDTCYDHLAEILMDASLAQGSRLSEDGRVPPLPALATHDEKRIEHACAYAAKVELPKVGMEFQMLHGIRRDLQEQLARQGYPVRIYVPFGTEWYPYFMRRLAERPANVWFFISNFFKK